MSDGLAKSAPPQGAPVKIVHTMLERLLDCRRRHAVTGSDAQAAHGKSRPAQEGAFKRSAGVCRMHGWSLSFHYAECTAMPAGIWGRMAYFTLRRTLKTLLM